MVAGFTGGLSEGTVRLQIRRSFLARACWAVGSAYALRAQEPINRPGAAPGSVRCESKSWLVRTSIQFLVLAVCVLSASNSDGAVFGTVTGLVEDPQHQPIAHVLITLRSPSSGWQRTAETDVDGRFVLHAVRTGDYVISAAMSTPLQRPSIGAVQPSRRRFCRLRVVKCHRSSQA